MKPSIVLAIALFWGSIPLAAQASAGVSGVQGSTFGVAGVQGGGCVSIGSASGPLSAPKCGQGVAACPAIFTARHLSDGSMIRTGRTHPKGIGQRLHVTLNVPHGAIATLAVHGFSNKGRMTETDSGSSPDAVRKVTVYLAPAPNGQAGGDLWAPGLTAVTSIDLVSLSYDDGSSWNAQDGHACRVTPDPMMLISGR
jgi:hypothetical protein